MGSYLSTPKTAKASVDVEGMGLKVGVSEMQGWRVSMEDAHCIDMEFSEGMVLVGVLDGHGGGEVAKFVASRFPDVLRSQADFEKASSASAEAIPELLGSALRAAFLEIDAAILTPPNVAALQRLAEEHLSDSEDDPEGDEVSDLANDATIPIEKLVAEYVRREAEAKANGDAAGPAGGSDDDLVARGSSILSALLNGDRIETDDPDDDADGDADADANGDSGNGHDATTDEVLEAEMDQDEAAEAAETSRKRGAAAGGGGGLSEASPSKRVRVQLQSSSEGVGVTSGTTAVFALICTLGDKRVVVVANAGDSRAVLSRSGQALDLSEDHKPEDEKEKARVEAAGGRVGLDGRVNGGLNLSRALGDHQYKRNEALPATAQLISPEPDITVTELQPEDRFLVLACDGIWNSLTSDEVVSFVDPRLSDAVRDGAPVSKLCEELCDACMSPTLTGDGTGLDNETAMVILL
eukprot:m.120214 g.120214  ORF g.120214 m.120214 type:complete len:467 (-) comp13339_c0_seq1:1767-3167(-)